MKMIIIAWIQLFSAQHNLDPILVEAIVRQESQYEYQATGKIGEIGLLQMRWEYLDKPKKYYNPYQNLKEGISRLSKMKSLENELGRYWFVAWNLGPTGALKYHKKHGIKNFKYGRSVYKHYYAIMKEMKKRPLNYQYANAKSPLMPMMVKND